MALLPIVFAYGQETNNFEAELRLLEKQDETLLKQVETISKEQDNEITDSVTVGNAAPLREKSIPDQIPSPKVKERRVRSR